MNRESPGFGRGECQGLDCRAVTGEGAAGVAGVSASWASQVLLALPALLGPGSTPTA
jgi:hypothetical protein